MRPVLGAVERKAASRSGLLLEGKQTRTCALIRSWLKPAAGSKGLTSHHFQMPRSDRACRSESKLPEGHLEPLHPARLTARIARSQLRHLIPRSLPGRGLSSREDCPYRGSAWVLRYRNCFRSNLVTPLEICFCRFKGGEITAAGRTAPRSGAGSKQESSPARRVIVLRRPLR